jgi:hypothetical protein
MTSFRPVPKSPASYIGSLSDLYERWIKDVLIPPDVVEAFHRQFAEYLREANPLFLIRKVRDQERGAMMRTADGARMRPTDNSPAWWVHYQLFAGGFQTFPTFRDFIEAVPCHMFEVRLRDNINGSGWHVAHVFDVKDRNVDFLHWDRRELARRFARNIHPCNSFYIPKPDWQRYGGHPTVIEFFIEKYRRRYRAVWNEFLSMVDASVAAVPGSPGDFTYEYGHRDRSRVPSIGDSSTAARPVQEGDAVYRYSRLCFKAEVIEALKPDEVFCVVTPGGTFRMTKREFYEEFPRVLSSPSYRIRGLYHFPKPPKRSLKFRVMSSENGTGKDTSKT